MKRQCLAGYQQDGQIGSAQLTSPTQRATWHPSTDKRVFLGALGSMYKVAKPWWSLRPRRIALRSRLADSGPGYRPKAALSPTDSALAQPGHGAESQAAKGPGDATHIHAPVNRTFNLRPNCRLEAVLWPGPSPTLRWFGVTPAGPDPGTPVFAPEEEMATPVFSPGKSQGQRSLVGYSPRAHKELDVTEHTPPKPSCVWMKV